MTAGPTQHGIQISWTDAGGADPGVTANVYRSTVSGASYSKLNTSSISGGTYLDQSGVPGTAYFYVVTDVDASGNESGYSTQVTAIYPTDPNAPTGVTATVV